jgi:hypothetical protein
VAVVSVVAASLKNEVGAWALLSALHSAAYDGWLPWPLALHHLVLGVLGGGAYAVAEALTRRWGVAVGCLGAAPLVLAALLGARFALELVLGGRAAGVAAVAAGFGSGEALGVFLAGALLLHGPLLAARRRGASVPVQIYAMTGGGLVWLAALVALPTAYWAYNLAICLAPVVARPLLFPPGLWLGGHRAKWLDGQASARAAAGEWAAAAEAWEEAYGLWPAGERAAAAARAWARLDEPYRATAALRRMLDHPSPGAGALDDPAFAGIADLEDFQALRRRPLPRPAASAVGQRGALTPRHTLHALAGGSCALLVALAISPAYTPDLPAEVHRQRIRCAFVSEPAALYQVAIGLDMGCAWVVEPEESVGLTRALLRLDVPPPSGQDPREARWWYRRAAEAGHPDAKRLLGSR